MIIKGQMGLEKKLISCLNYDFECLFALEHLHLIRGEACFHVSDCTSSLRGFSLVATGLNRRFIVQGQKEPILN